jgi:transportin-1
MFQTLLQGFRQSNEAEWAAQVTNFPPVIQQRLATRYGV